MAAVAVSTVTAAEGEMTMGAAGGVESSVTTGTMTSPDALPAASVADTRKWLAVLRARGVVMSKAV